MHSLSTRVANYCLVIKKNFLAPLEISPTRKFGGINSSEANQVYHIMVYGGNYWDSQNTIFLRKTWKPFWSLHDHAMIHDDHVQETCLSCRPHASKNVTKQSPKFWLTSNYFRQIVNFYCKGFVWVATCRRWASHFQKPKTSAVWYLILHFSEKQVGRNSRSIPNQTMQPISKIRRNRRFCKRGQIAFNKIVSLIEASLAN